MPNQSSSKFIKLLALSLVILTRSAKLIGGEQVSAFGSRQVIDHRQSEGSPAITSLHQVWTSSSSGRLDELSPQLIGKLRSDVPFLAAYAMRPRLVGGGQQLVAQASGSPSTAKFALVGAASSPATSSLLSNINELDVETSSTSKSEHHHRRRTNIKRRPKARGQKRKSGEARDRKRALAAASQLLKRRRAASSVTRTSIGPLRLAAGKRSASGRNGLARQSHRRTSRLKRRMNRTSFQHHMRIIRHGALIEGKDEPVADTTMAPGVKGGDDQRRVPKEPFYSSIRPSTKTRQDESAKDDRANELNPENGSDDDGESTDDQMDYDEPRALVGAGDEPDEEDIAQVEPKSDGIDDDYEVPNEEHENDDKGKSEGQPIEPPEESLPDDSSENELDHDEPRGRRVHRERPNMDPEPALGSAGGGGGIGVATGAQPENAQGDGDGQLMGSAESGSKGSVGSDGEGSTDDQEPVTPGVEFAEPKARDDKQGPLDEPQNDRRPAEMDDEQQTGSSQGSSSRAGMSLDGAKANDGASSKTDDVDYRDQDGGSDHEADDRAHKTSMRDGHHHEDDNCHDDHHHDHGHHHHDHHDTIEWLRGAIPGEPREDYPIYGRVKPTNFSCQDQKYPGYYADVESRCQVFHICQADGRMDSFLCPNGTIFSQKSYVCVWWNSFECEDAPKFYNLNSLLYKTQPASSERRVQHGSSLMPLDGARVRPLNKGADEAPLSVDEEEQDSGIETLIRDMRRRNNFDGTVQTKSSELEAVDELEGPSSRILAPRSRRVSQAEPRKRKRRASPRQAPPKLKSRRVSSSRGGYRIRKGNRPRRRS